MQGGSYEMINCTKQKEEILHQNKNREDASSLASFRFFIFE